MSPRDTMLAAIREALGPAPHLPEIPRAYRAAGSTAADIDLFCARAADYRATVHRTTEAALPGLLSELLTGRSVAIPPALSQRPSGAELRADDPPLTAAGLDAVDSVLTGCALAVAETGTIVLDGDGVSGRRMLTLVPDHHVCVVREDQIVATVPDAIAALDPRRPLTFISGPSATSDIELERVEGVHGPRTLDVVVVG